MEKKIIKLENLSSYNFTKIEAENTLNKQKFDSGILFTPEDITVPCEIIDKLIRLAAKWTNRFASDLLIDIDSLRKNFAEIINNEEKSNILTVYFGFRKDGVDHKEFIEIRTPTEYSTIYSEVWKLEIYMEPFNTNTTWKLVQISDYVSEYNMVEVNS